MDRVAVKEEAKKKIKGNLWTIWKPLVLFELCVFVIFFIIGFLVGLLKLDKNVYNIVLGVLSFCASFIETGFMFAYAKYILSFIRGEKFDWNDVKEYTKKHMVRAFVISFVVGLIIIGCSILLVIPGIIAAIGLTFYEEVAVDNEDLGTMDVIKKAWAITNGHKMDIFVFTLSFIGWEILASLTFGILYIWLMPYIVVATAMVYEKLK